MTVRHQVEAEAATESMPPRVNKTEAQDLRVRFEQVRYKMEDKGAKAGGWKNMSLVQFMSLGTIKTQSH